MTKAKLISITQPIDDSVPSPEALMIYIARVSSKNQNNPNYEKLLHYCMRHGHWSVFEQVSMTIEIETSLAIATQILRHRSFCFQQLCMSGDTEVYFDLPAAIKKGKRQLYKLTLEELHRKWYGKDALGQRLRPRIAKMNLRTWNIERQQFEHTQIKEVFKTGVKELFEVVLENGKTFKSTADHKVLTQQGFQSLKEAFGLQRKGNVAVVRKKGYIGCNGIPQHQNYDWLAEMKEKSINSGKGVDWIAQQAGVSYHTIRKWLRKLNLGFSNIEVAQITSRRGGVWNKGFTGYSWGKHSEETKALLRQKARRGSDNPLWRGGTTTERAQIQSDIAKYRIPLIEDYRSLCGLCGGKLSGRVDLHHIVPVFEDESLAREYSNLMPVHHTCHMRHHGQSGHHKTWREYSRGNTLTVQWSQIKSVKYLGKEMTYDLETVSNNHNYVANGVIVHNSRRYSSDNISFQFPELRRQDTKNRQASHDDLSSTDRIWWATRVKALASEVTKLYSEALSLGAAKECARFILPEMTTTKLYMTGNVRSWIHYLQVRGDPSTQKEHRDVAKAIMPIFSYYFPVTAEAMKSLKEEKEEFERWKQQSKSSTEQPTESKSGQNTSTSFNVVRCPTSDTSSQDLIMTFATKVSALKVNCGDWLLRLNSFWRR